MANKKSETQKCSMCGEIKIVNTSNFYKSYSILYKSMPDQRMSICKNCVFDLYNNFVIKFEDKKRAVYETCKLLDIYYCDDIYNAAVKQAKKQKSEVLGIYMTKVLSLQQYRNKIFLDSDSYDKEEELKRITCDVERDAISFWGEGLSIGDYKYLENEYKNLTTRFESDSYSQEMLFQEIAFQRLDIKKKRAMGQSVDKELKTLQDLLGSSGIKPIQESANMASDQSSFGTLIKKYENEKPIPEPLESWTTHDWIRKYVVVWFLGNLCNMLGKANPFKEEWEEEMDKYTVRNEEESE